MSDFPTISDFELRDKIARAFMAAHRTWNGNEPTEKIVAHVNDAYALAGIAVTIFRKQPAP